LTFWLHSGWTLSLPFDLAFVAALVALVFIDAEHQFLPNVITYPGAALAFAARLLVPNLYGVGFLCAPGSCPPDWLLSLANALLGALAGGGFLWAVGWLWERARKEEAMGLGDVKMMFMVGAYLGWPLALLTIFIGVLSGSVVGLGLIAAGRGHLKSRLPFGVYLGLGAFICLLCGQALVNWYVSKF
jgi:leader peptidase (prepilin peptidase)/N-methyltransferase